MEHYPKYFLRNADIRARAAQQIAGLPLDADKPLVVEVKELTRSLDQSAKFHAMCADVSRQLSYMGRALTPEQWKILFISGHAIATKQPSEVVPGLEGEFCNIRESSARMSVKRMASLIEYVYAYATEREVRFYERAVA